MAIFSHIVSTEHSGSSAFGDANDYLKELIKQVELSGEDELVMILADYFSMTSLVPFYHACTHKNKYADKIKPVMGLKITIQADVSISFTHTDGDFFLDEKGHLILDDGDFYKIILDGCSLDKNDTDDGEVFRILKGKKEIVDESNRLTDEGKSLISKFKEKLVKKPVFDKDHDIIVIAKNEQGRRNINNLVSFGHKIELDSGYKKVNWRELKNLSEGLMMISGGKNGSIEKACEKDNFALAKNRIELFNEIFDKEDIYLQIQRVENTVDGQETEEKIINYFKELSNDLNISLFACNDVRFPKKENYRDFIIRKKAMDKKEMYDPSDIVDITEEQYLKPTIEMIKLFEDVPESIVNTVKLTEKTDLKDYRLRLYQSYLPKFPIPEEFDNLDGISQDILNMEEGAKKDKEIVDFKASKFLRHLSYEGLKNRWERICKNQNIFIGERETKNGTVVTQEYIDKLYKSYEDQIDMELEVIHRTGFPGYFLIVQDVCNWCKENDIPVGPGRGSGAGSMVLYCLQITDIDSMEYDLLFERFLNPERVGEPDIDIDFSPRQRQRVIKYVADTYGIENTAQILTYGTMAAKDVVDNVGRVLGMLPEERNRIKDLISPDPGTKLINELDPDAGNEKLLKLRSESPQVDMILTAALELEGATKSYGKHAGGVVISFGEMDQYAGLYQESKEQGVTEDHSLLEKLEELGDVTLVPTVQVDKNLCEDVGLIKFDFLGLKNLDIIDDCIKFLNKTNPELKDFKASDISPHDKKALELFKEADTYGIFQFESPAMRRLMKNLYPETFAEVIALVALFRPGPLQSGMADSFVNRKHGKEKLEYPHPDLSVLLKETYGTIIYQEQVMSISRILAGFTRGEADTLRKAMGKKIFELMKKMRKLFAEGAGHKYRDDVKKTTKGKWKSVLDSSKTLEIDINLDNIELDFVKNLFIEEDPEHIEKTKGKFGFFGKFISTKEQVLAILKEFADLDDQEIEELTETIDLMKDQEFLKAYKLRIEKTGIEKLKEQGLSAEDAEMIIARLLVGCGIFVRFNVIFSTMNEFAAYGFNASHSVAYAAVSMQTAFLKSHYPAQYMAALLTNESNLDKLSITSRECRRMGINIMKPNINKSELGFMALSGNKKERNIRYGLGQIKGIAKKAKPLIERRKQHGIIKDIYEFYNVFAEYKTQEVVKKQGIVKEQKAKVVNKTVLNALLNSGALDCLCPEKDSNYRPMLLATYHHIDATLTDLKKRLKKNFGEIKKKINLKNGNIDYKEVLNNIDLSTKEYLGLDEHCSKAEFLSTLETNLIPEDLTKYDLNKVFDIYNTVDKLFVGKTNYTNTDNLIEQLILIIEDAEIEGLDTDKDSLISAVTNMKEKLNGLSINMIINYATTTLAKLDKSIKSLEKELNKKTAKAKAKKIAKEKLDNIKTSDEYIFTKFFNLVTGKDGVVCETTESIMAKGEIESSLDNKQIKFTPIFNIEDELKTSHSGEDIEMAEFVVNGIKHYYVIPTTKETDLVPYLNSKERSVKEFEATGMYQTAHPLMVDAMSENLKAQDFNIVPLGSILPVIAQKGYASKKNPNKHYMDAKIAGTVLEVSDFRGYNENNERMETRITLVIDDGTGIVSAKFTAEDMFTAGREDQGLKMLLDMKKKKSDILLFEGAMTQGSYESEGAMMYVNKMGSANPDIYLPLEDPDLNKVEEVVIEPASTAQLNFAKSLLRKAGVELNTILESYDVENIENLSKQQAGEIITMYSSK